MPGGFLRGWTMRSSTSPILCLPSLFRYMLNLLFFFSYFPLPYMSWLLMVENCNRRSLLPMSSLTFHISLGRSMLMALMALLESVPCPSNPNVMGYHFPPNTQAVSSSFFFVFSLFGISLFLVWSLTLLSLNCSPLSKSMRNWHGWLGISSWRWPTIQGTCTVLEGRPIRAVVVMMMMTVTMMEVMRRIQRRLLAISQGRVGTIDYLQSRHICTQHTTFSLFVLFIFLVCHDS